MALKSSNKVDTNIYEIEVTVDSEAFKKACTQAYLKQRNKIQLPGFRKGKAPQAMIEKMYGEEMFYEDALDIVYPAAVSAAIDEAGLEAVDAPFDLDVPVIGKDTGVEMKMKVTVYPEVKLGDYKGLKVKKNDTEVTDEEVENELHSLQERNSRLVVADDRAAQNGDTVSLDFEGFVDGVAFDGGKGENYPLELGTGSFIPGFEDQVCGHKIDEDFDVNVTFPEDYAEELAGKEAVFKCKIHEIKAKELPELDDDFAQSVSEDLNTIDELKADIKKQLAEKKEKDSKEKLENDLLEQVCTNMQVEIPDCMIESRQNDMLRDYEYRLQAQGLDLDTYLKYMGQDRDSFKETFKEAAEKQVKVSIALRAVIEAEKIEATDEEIDSEAEKIGKQYSMDAEQVKKILSADQLSQDVKRNKAVDLIVSSAVIE